MAAAYSIAVRASVEKQLAALDKPVRRRVVSAITALATEPRPPGAIPLKGAPGVLRIRVGDYRIIYSVDDAELIVLVIDVGHRRQIYRGH
ncbi:type II toxin-antitoxin system RelE/ParE family toxin [Actinoallomurus acanthiterrae]